MKAARLKFRVWTVDSAPVARRLAGLGIDGIITNRPGWLRAQLPRPAAECVQCYHVQDQVVALSHEQVTDEQETHGRSQRGDFVPGSMAYRLGLVWPLTQEAASLSKRYDVNKDYRDILHALAGENAKFLLVGAYAMAVHGYPRATMDI